MNINNVIRIRNLGLHSWDKTFYKMFYFSKYRNQLTKDEIWLVEHYPIYIQGKYHDKKNINKIQNIPVMKSNRGGNITYHGPGQQIFYLLINLKRKKISIRKFIDIIQESVVNTLFYYKIKSNTYKKYPGVYVNNKKICSLGLKIINGCSMHGFALNIKMDLSPFNFISPCGFKYLKMTQISDINSKIKKKYIVKKILEELIKLLNILYIEYI